VSGPSHTKKVPDWWGSAKSSSKAQGGQTRDRSATAEGVRPSELNRERRTLRSPNGHAGATSAPNDWGLTCGPIRPPRRDRRQGRGRGSPPLLRGRRRQERHPSGSNLRTPS
jgi:hypothetical protein